MVARDFEYRHRFWIMLLVYAAAYAFYNLDPLNILYSIVPWNRGVVEKDMLVRFLYAAAALAAAAGAMLLTWATAWRPQATNAQSATFPALSMGGPFRYARNPHYVAYFLLILALGTFQSRTGFPIMLLGETIFLLRLVNYEETRLAQEYGEAFRDYANRVPRLWPSRHGRVPEDSSRPSWPQAVWKNAFQWGFVLTLLAFAFTLSDPVGYRFAGATLLLVLLQTLFQALFMRSRAA